MEYRVIRKRPAYLSATFVKSVNIPGRYGAGLVLPSATRRILSQSGLPKQLRDLGIDAVPRRFRSSFCDWAAECTEAPREVCELVLAHVNSDRVEAAYRRSDLSERRRTGGPEVLLTKATAREQCRQRPRGRNWVRIE